MAAAPGKRCLYDVLGLPRDCFPEEIRSAYKKLALQRHPDKLMQTGVSPDDATAQFQELLHAYETLFDPKQRSWYDSHRSQILFSDPNAASAGSPIPDLFAFFSTSVFSGYSDSGKGFCKVNSDVFNKIYANEVNFAKKMELGVDAVNEAPLMGNSDSPYEQVTAFYGYWLGFCTVMDFVWADVYDAERGENRKSRRVMEEENKKVRKKAKREYNETVRGLAEFVKKRDRRVTLRRKEEEERRKKKEEERERERKEKMQREKAERARKYEEAEWTKVEDNVEEWEDKQDGEEGEEEEEEGELYCVACGKKFKSKNQWENHEKSKKHKEKVAALRKSFVDDDFRENDEEETDEEDNELEEMTRKVREAFDISEDEEEDGKVKTEEINEEDEGIDTENGMGEEQGRPTEPDSRDRTGEAEKVVGSSGDDGGIDEVNLLSAMLGGRKNRRKKVAMEESVTKATPQNREEKTEFMEYDNRKGSRRSRGGKKDKAKKNNKSAGAASETATSNLDEKVTNDSPDRSRGRDESKDVANGNTTTNPQVHDKKRGMKADDGMSSKMKNATTKGRKAKAASKCLDNTCEGCCEDFDSRNKLHNHLGETGHATKLKFGR